MQIRISPRCLSLPAFLAVILISSLTQAQQELPKDPNNVYGQFDDGVKYIIRKNANPPGKVAMDLHVKSGSLNETDKQNGLAHFIEHMAFNGSEHFKAGELIPLLNKMGMIFGADSNAHTTFHETVYKLTMPDNKPETIDLALTIFGDYAGALDFSDKEIDSERGVILEEARALRRALMNVFRNGCSRKSSPAHSSRSMMSSVTKNRSRRFRAANSSITGTPVIGRKI